MLFGTARLSLSRTMTAVEFILTCLSQESSQVPLTLSNPERGIMEFFMSTTNVHTQATPVAPELFTGDDLSRGERGLHGAQQADQACARQTARPSLPSKGSELQQFLESCPTVAFQFIFGDRNSCSTLPSPGVISDILFAFRTGHWEQARTCWSRPVEPRSALYDYVGREIRKLTNELIQCDEKFVLLWMLPSDEKCSFCFNCYESEEDAIRALAVECRSHIESMLISPW